MADVADVAQVDTAATRPRGGREAPSGGDGRAARSQRTRDSVVEALLDLLDDGNPRPTAREIAARAGVSLRSVYVHFDDLEDLFLAAAGRQLERMSPLIGAAPPKGPLAVRLPTFVEQHCRLLEAAAPVRRAGMLQAPFSPTIAEVLQLARDAGVAELETVFRDELEEHTEPGRRALLLALEIASNASAWETLRTHEGLAESAARAVMVEMLGRLLGGDASPELG